MRPTRIREVYMIKGGIYKGKFNYRAKNYYHPIICLSDTPTADGRYHAAIITHDKKRRRIRTVPMLKEHFLVKDSNTHKKFNIQFDNSRLVIRGFEKILAKTNKTLQGMLTDKGIDFVEKKLRMQTFTQDNRPIWEIK